MTQYNPEFMETVSERLEKLQEYIKSGPTNDFYSNVAAIIYNKPYEQCREINTDGSVNLEGKEMRKTVKQMFIPVALECNGLIIDEDEI